LGLLGDAWQYIQDNPDRFREALSVHIRLSVYALIAAIVIFVPLGILASRGKWLSQTVVGVISALRVVPSLAVIFLLYPYRRELGDLLPMFDRSFSLALIALTLLAGPPLVINTDAAMRGIDPAVVESARGLGMNRFQVFFRVQLPLALPVMIAGVRTASVEIIASATLAAFIGVGGLGRFITSGLTLYDFSLLLVGAIPVTLLTLFAEGSLAAIERWVKPPTTSRAPG
jgi:osmoprotectant transport system permease protein